MGVQSNSQVITVENSDPPAAVRLQQVTKFIGKNGDQRFGYIEKAITNPLLP
jgi:hypothetical protein